MNFDNTIVTRSKNKRKILYELNENGELEEVTEGVTLNIKKKSKIIDNQTIMMILIIIHRMMKNFYLKKKNMKMTLK